MLMAMATRNAAGIAMPNPQSVSPSNKQQKNCKPIVSSKSVLDESVLVATTPGADIGSDAGKHHHEDMISDFISQLENWTCWDGRMG